ncbi:MAG TPA: sensor histidine kinase [Chroococcales cyanobacterium]
MRRLIQFQTHPFRLLLYLEWILLGMTFLTRFPLVDVPPPPPHDPIVAHSSLLTILSIALFGMMGLQLPKGRLFSKVLYTGVGFGLILLAAVGGGRGISFSPSLLLILVIRSCLIFGLTGRLLVAGLAFASVLLSLFLRLQNVPEFPVSGRRDNFRTPIAEPAPKLHPHRPQKGFIVRREISPDQVRRLVLNLTINTALLFGLVLVFVLLLVNALLAERQSRQKLAIANEQLRQYARRIEDQATLEERNRIAREIHDSLGHSLTAQSIQLENAMMFLRSNVDKAQVFLTEAKQLGKDALQEVRQSIATLRSNPLQGRALEDALASLVEDFRRRSSIEAECQINFSSQIQVNHRRFKFKRNHRGTEFAQETIRGDREIKMIDADFGSSIVPDSVVNRSLPPEISTAIYRIVKEVLTNIYKHSEATQVKIRLLVNPEALYLFVEDNGKGFDPEQNTTGFGLHGMRERAVALAGQFSITSQPGAGCQITVYIPLPTRYP